MKGVKVQKERKIKKIKQFENKALQLISSLTDKEFLIAGLSLYWGEGNRKNPGVRFSNSDPQIIKFIITWFKKNWNLTDERFSIFITINEIHKDRIDDVVNNWQKITKLKKENFKKPIFIKSENKKIYSNHNEHFGTLSIRITKSTDLYYEIMGLIKALGMAG